MDNIAYKPISVGPPGEIVLEYLESISWTQKELARRTGITTKSISEVCNGKARITPLTALAFEKALGRPAHFWLNLQTRYEEALARKEEWEKSKDWLDWARKFPISEMKKRGWIPKGRRSNATDLLKYLGVSSPDSWDEVWNAQNVAYRQTRLSEPNSYAISAWLRAVEMRAEEIDVQGFDERALVEVLSDIKACTRLDIVNALNLVKDTLAKCGVALVIEPALPKTGVSGCTRWINKQKVIVAITLRYKWDDQIWFTLFHELGHVLLHRRAHTTILDNPDDHLGDNVVDPEMQAAEEEANRFAADVLIPPKLLQEFISYGVLQSEHIEEFANAVGVAPGIVVGRLQRDGLLESYMGNALKQRVNWSYTNSEG